MFRVQCAVAVCLALVLATVAEAQTIGTFRWQLQPYCNVVTVTITQNGPVYELEGTDDQCGAAQAASASGTAFLNPDGSIGFGLAIVTAPGGSPVHVNAAIDLGTLGGAWHDSAGNTGAFVATPGASAGGSPRPAPTSAAPQGSIGGAQINPAQVQARVTGACAAGTFMQTVGQDGNVSCAVETGDVAGVTAGPGLIGGGQSGNVSVALPQSGSGAFAFVNNSGLVAFGGIDGSPLPTDGPGRRLMWYPGKSAFRVGAIGGTQWDNSNIGIGSVAMGVNSTALGPKAFAMGDAAQALGSSSAALGFFTLASGSTSFAMGDNAKATGNNGVAFGYQTTAGGAESVAMGRQTTATGAHAFAMGDGAVASGGNSIAMGAQSTATAFEAIALGLRVQATASGSVVLGSDAAAYSTAHGTFLFADRSTTDDFTANLPNEFGVRAAGGVYLYTNSNLTTGCWIPSGGGAWQCTSDRNTKEHFEPVDGEMVLTKLRAMPITQWSYKTEPGVVHVGPVAQDFHAAFGLGADDKSIGNLDSSGIALRAIQALETRTQNLNEALVRENDALKSALAAVHARLERLEAKDCRQ